MPLFDPAIFDTGLPTPFTSPTNRNRDLTVKRGQDVRDLRRKQLLLLLRDYLRMRLTRE